jgi:hypothetical protein
MEGGVLDDDGTKLLGHQPGQAFLEFHADLTDALRAESDGGGQHQIGPIRLDQVHRADIAAKMVLE